MILLSVGNLICYKKKKKKKTFPGWSTNRSKVLPHGKCLGGLGSQKLLFWWTGANVQVTYGGLSLNLTMLAGNFYNDNENLLPKLF